VVALVFGVLALGAAGITWWVLSDRDGEAATTTRNGEPSPSTEPTQPTTTAAPSEEDEFRQIALDLLETRNDVYQNPAPGRVDEYLVPTSSVYEAEATAIDDLVSRGHHTSGPPYRIRGIRFLGMTEEGGVTLADLDVVVEGTGADIVDADGRVVQDVVGGSIDYVYVGLVSSGGSWRFAGVDQPDLPDDVRQRQIDEILQQGLP
jgi:hypothetical protein